MLQGPNYALSKTLQMWRAVLARAQGHVVSANMAPGCRTESVTHNKTVATALKGLSFFPPLVAFDAVTVAPIMCALALFDLGAAAGESSAHPGTALDNPLQLFVQGAFHGGGWRCPFNSESVGTAGYLLGLTQ